MTALIVKPAPAISLPVQGSGQRFPIHRVFCVGRNYPWEGAVSETREPPLYFMKPASSVVEAIGAIAFPPMTEAFCHEIELVVAIGQGGQNIPQSRALEHVFGYAAGLDLTRRDLQLEVKSKGQPWEAAKVFDGSAPISAINPVSRMGHPLSGAIWLSVNGAERQRSDLSRQIWSVAEIISLFSRYITLMPGDLIMTGTPQGVAALESGDVIKAGIEGIAELTLQVGVQPNLHQE